MRVAPGACTRLNIGVNIAKVEHRGEHYWRWSPRTSISDGFSCPRSTFLSPLNLTFVCPNKSSLLSCKFFCPRKWQVPTESRWCFGGRDHPARLEALDCLSARHNCMFCLHHLNHHLHPSFRHKPGSPVRQSDWAGNVCSIFAGSKVLPL